MRRFAVVLFVIALVVAGVSSASGESGGRLTKLAVGGRLTKLAGGLVIRVPSGWHVIRGWLSDVTEPIPRLAIASFAARLSRNTCNCGFPNVEGFPSDGAFLFMWEYSRPSKQMLRSLPRRPSRFHITSASSIRATCDGSSDSIPFQDSGRAFQAEIYLGPDVPPQIRSRVLGVMDSLRVTPQDGAGRAIASLGSRP